MVGFACASNGGSHAAPIEREGYMPLKAYSIGLHYTGCMPDEPARGREATEWLHPEMPFAATLGLVEGSATRERVEAALAWDPALCTIGGVLHGGALMALADSVGGYCAMLNLPEGATGTATIESKTNFLRPVLAGRVRATARPLHVGRTVIVVDTELRDDQERLVARTTQTQAVLSPRS
jgi:uncharacterized protein (TIGR00369 family)